MIRALAAVAIAAATGALAHQADARACRLPPRPLGTHGDSAAWCAREFIIRNGYTQAPASSDRNDVALEPSQDVGAAGYDNMLDFRRNTVSIVPFLACQTPTGYLVSFTMPNQLEQTYGRGVAMTRQFLGITLLRPWVRLDPAIPPNCWVPKLP